MDKIAYYQDAFDKSWKALAIFLVAVIAVIIYVKWIR